SGITKCNCDVDAKELVVKKDGPNKGRAFFRCGNNDNCNFFAWKDETTSNHGGGGGQRQGGNNQPPASRKRRSSDNDEEGKQRKCGLCKGLNN
ncbi:unnamed protein product, partial [Adineta steineri]